MTPTLKLNLWAGWGCESRKGDVSLFLALLSHLINDPVMLQWFLMWLAYPLQNPGAKLSTAVVLYGLQGAGKSTIGETMKRIYGSCNTAVIDQAGLVRDFNGWAANKQFLIGEEITGGLGRNLADLLKNLITGVTLLLNQKYQPTIEIPNRLNCLFSTNHSNAFHLEKNDRRLVIFEVNDQRLPTEFFKQFYEWLNKDGASAVFDYLLSLDLSDFNPYAHAPMTQAKARMIEGSRSQAEQWCHDLLEDPDSVLTLGDASKRDELFTTKRLLEIYSATHPSTLSEKGMATALRSVGVQQVANGESIEIPNSPVGRPRRVRLWIVRNHEELTLLRGPELAKLYSKQQGYLKGGKRKHSR